MSIQEAAEVEENPYLDRLFGPDVLGRLPTTGLDLVRKTALGLIGEDVLAQPPKRDVDGLASFTRSLCVMVRAYIDYITSECPQRRRRGIAGTVFVSACSECSA